MRGMTLFVLVYVEKDKIKDLQPSKIYDCSGEEEEKRLSTSNNNSNMKNDLLNKQTNM